MGLVTDEQLGPIRQEADSTGEGLVDTLVAKKIVSAGQVAQAKASQFGVEFVNLGEMRLTDDVISAVPRHIAKKYNVIPVYRHDNTVTVALSDPSEPWPTWVPWTTDRSWTPTLRSSSWSIP